MLNLVNLLKKNENKVFPAKGNNIRIHKRDIPMNKEWFNSLYSFNKNIPRIYPAVYNHVFKLLKWYFNMTSNFIENNIQSGIYKKISCISDYKLWVSNPEMKHYNEKINITIYIYNNTYNLYKEKLGFLQSIWWPTLITKKKNFPLYIGTNRAVYNNSYDYYKKLINWLKLNQFIYIYQLNLDISNIVSYDKLILESIQHLKIQNYNYLINLYNKELICLKYKQKILFDDFKYNEALLPFIIKFLQNIYNKNIELNIISLKYFWLSTSILSQIITTKVKNPEYRGIHNKAISDAMEEIRVPILSKNKLAGEIKPYIGVQNKKLNEFHNNEKDCLNKFLLANSTQSNVWSDDNIDGLVLRNLENKTIVGVSIKIAGRLTKRYKAQKAIERVRYKGTLKNVYSAHRNYSSSLLRGHDNINIEKVRIGSKVRIGTFGLTGWIASY